MPCLQGTHRQSTETLSEATQAMSYMRSDRALPAHSEAEVKLDLVGLYIFLIDGPRAFLLVIKPSATHNQTQTIVRDHWKWLAEISVIIAPVSFLNSTMAAALNTSPVFVSPVFASPVFMASFTSATSSQRRRQQPEANLTAFHSCHRPLLQLHTLVANQRESPKKRDWRTEQLTCRIRDFLSRIRDLNDVALCVKHDH